MKDNSTEDSEVSKDLIVPKQHELSAIFDEISEPAFIDGEFETSVESIQELDIPDDKVELSSDVMSAIGSGAVGAAAAGSLATAAGASTLLGSTSLASVLGGVFVTTTPIGWVVGAAVAAGAAGYGISKLINSINKDDESYLKLEHSTADFKSRDTNGFYDIAKSLLSDVIDDEQIKDNVNDIEIVKSTQYNLHTKELENLLSNALEKDQISVAGKQLHPFSF